MNGWAQVGAQFRLEVKLRDGNLTCKCNISLYSVEKTYVWLTSVNALTLGPSSLSVSSSDDPSPLATRDCFFPVRLYPLEAFFLLLPLGGSGL